MSRAEPRIVLALWDGLDFIDEAGLDRLAEVGTILDRSPLQSWDDARADRLLAEADVLVGHWGCPPLDDPAADQRCADDADRLVVVPPGPRPGRLRQVIGAHVGHAPPRNALVGEQDRPEGE
ncbi:MAG: hypothetical protein AAGK32_16340, partial [Actinomycetota bacterium]